MFSKIKFWKKDTMTTSATSKNRSLTNGTLNDRVESYVTAFVREFELRLFIYNLILQGEIEKAKTLSTSYTKEIVGHVAQAGGAIGGIISDVVLGSAPISLTSAVTSGFEIGQSGRKAGEWLGQQANAVRHDKKREKYTNILWDVIRLHREDRVSLRKELISAAVQIFRSFEFQFLSINNNEKWQEGMIDLAKDGVCRAINYYVIHHEDTNKTHEEMISNGAIYGKSKKRPFYAKPNLIYINEFGEMKWSSSSLYEKTGIALKENDSYSYYERKDETNRAKKYGYRRLLCTEYWNDIKDDYKLSQEDSNSRFRDYEYQFETLNDNEKEKILSKINSDYEQVTKGDLKGIMEEVKESIVNDLNRSIKLQAGDKDPQVHKILQEMTNNINNINTEELLKLNEIKELGKLIFQEVQDLHRKFDQNISTNRSELSAENESILFNIQAPVQLFTGRKKELNDLHKIVQRSHERNIVMTVIWGLGGVGKTQLALEYIDKFAKNIYENIVWIDSESKSHIDDSFQKLSKDLKINFGLEEEKTEVINQIYEKLSKRNTLIIFDNAENDKDLQDFLPHGSYPDDKKMHVIITSQNREWGINIEDFHLSEFSSDDGMQLVKKGLSITDASQDENINKLLDKLQNFPLCIIQAISYIKDRMYETPAYTVGHYLYEFDEIPKKLLDSELFRGLANDPYKKTAYKTWMITTDKIRTDVSNGKIALKIFYIMSYLAPQNINIKIFLTLAENDRHKLDKGIRLLAKYSLINTVETHIRTENTEFTEPRHQSGVKQHEIFFQIHRTVQDVTRLHIKEKNIEDEVIGNTFNVLKEYLTLIDTIVVDYDKMREAIPHFEAFLKQIKCRVIEHPKENDMEMYNEIVDFLSIGYLHLGNPGILKDILNEALGIKQKCYGHNHYKVAITLGNLGNAYLSLGDVQKAKELLERALNIQEKHYGPDHYQVAVTLGNLGIVYGSLGDVEKKKELLERALNIKEKHYGPDHYEVAVTLTNLGIVYGTLGDVQKAKETLERALNIQEKHYGPDHYEVSVTLTNLGVAYKSLGDVQKAKETLERALNIKEKHYGPDHYQVAVTLTNLGDAYRILGDVQKAKETLERALNIFEKHYGPDHYEVAVTLTNLRIVYGSLGDVQKKKGWLERAFSIKRKR